MSIIERQHQIDRFKSLKEVPVLIASVKAAGEGLNLTEASYVFHFDHWWNPTTMWQAEDRLHRKGQEKHVNVYSYWVNDTVEERIYNVLKRKSTLIAAIMSQLAGGAEISDDDLRFSQEDFEEILGIKRNKTP